MGCLYKLTSPNGKSYIGITLKTCDGRWEKHLEHARGKRANGAIYAALRKYGPESFTREALAECDDWPTLCGMEREAIRTHGTLSPGGYNLTLGGEGVQGPRSEADRLKISAAQKKRFERPEERERLRLNGIKGCNSPMAKAAREKKGRDRKPKPPPLAKEERSRRVREAMARPEVRAKVLRRAQERAADPAWREKVSESRRKAAHVRTPEWRAAIADKRRREWADPVMRAKRLAILAAAREAKKRKKEA